MWSWADVGRARVAVAPPTFQRRAVDPILVEQREKLKAIDAAMLAGRRAVWLPEIGQRDLKLAAQRAEYGH